MTWWRCAHRRCGNEDRIGGAGVFQIRLMDLSVKLKPVHLFYLILLIKWLRAIIREPIELRRIHDAGNSQGVGNIRVVLLGQSQHKLREYLKAIHNDCLEWPFHQVVVSHDKDYVHVSRLGLLIQPESIIQLKNTPTRNSDVVRVHGVSPVVGRGKKLWRVVNDHNLDPILWVGAI